MYFNLNLSDEERAAISVLSRCHASTLSAHTALYNHSCDVLLSNGREVTTRPRPGEHSSMVFVDGVQVA